VLVRERLKEGDSNGQVIDYVVPWTGPLPVSAGGGATSARCRRRRDLPRAAGSARDSDAPLAKDLRVLVRERLKEGDSNGQVIDYVVARYGEFVLLRPVFGWRQRRPSEICRARASMAGSFSTSFGCTASAGSAARLIMAAGGGLSLTDRRMRVGAPVKARAKLPPSAVPAE
jgi:hypothetical protein